MTLIFESNTYNSFVRKVLHVRYHSCRLKIYKVIFFNPARILVEQRLFRVLFIFLAITMITLSFDFQL